MSRIDDLIAKVAPKGVIYMTLAEIAQTVPGLTGKTKSDFSDGSARFVSYKNTFANLAIDQTAPDFVKVEPGEKQNRLRIGDVVFTGSSETAEDVGMSSVVTSEPSEPLYLNSFCFAVRFGDSELLLPGFSKYLFRGDAARAQIKRTASGVTRINVSKVRFMQIRIPVPPLEVQREIVRILDHFTELEAELEAELETRRRQYEHYRDELLTAESDAYTTFTIGELGRVVTGRTPKSSEPDLWGSELDFVTPSDIKNGMREISMPARRVSGAGRAALAKNIIPAGSILVTCIGADMGKTVINANDCVTNQQINAIILDGKASKNYLFHLLTAQRDFLRRQGEVGGSTLPLINKTNFSKIEIGLPPLRDQERIASMLDKFDALVNDLSSGLPAELAARRKQYEYYRDRLLTFEEAAA